MDKQPELAAIVQSFLSAMGLSLAMNIVESEHSILIEFEGDDQSLLTENEGAVLDAFQLLLRKVVEAELGLKKRVILDCAGYRKSREDDLVAFALEVAGDVLASGEAQEIGPYNSYERRLVHLALQKEDGVGTESLGDGSLKTILIKLT